MRFTKGWLVGVVVAALAGVGAPAGAVEGGGPTRVRVGDFAPGTHNLAFFLGLEKGFFARQGLEVVVRETSGTETVVAAAAGEIDVGHVGTPGIVGIAGGVPIHLVASPAVEWNPFAVVGGPKVRSVADLRGKRFGVGDTGGGGRQAAREILAAGGVREAEVLMFNTAGGAVGYAALQAGTVDAGVFSSPWIEKLELDGVGRPVARAADVVGRYQHNVLFASDRFIREHPEALRRFLRAYRESVRYAKGHFQETLAFGVRKTGLEERVIRRVLESQLARWNDVSRIDLEALANTIRTLKRIGDIDPGAKVTAQSAVDPRFLD